MVPPNKSPSSESRFQEPFRRKTCEYAWGYLGINEAVDRRNKYAEAR
jgi:hypothetical protein